MDPGTFVAIVTTSATVLSLLSEYYSNVKSAKKDIQRLSDEIEGYRNVLQEVQKQVNITDAVVPSLSRSSVRAIQDSLSYLEELEDKLTPKKRGRLMKSVGLRALKWPFTCKEVDKYITRLERRKATLNLALSTDQTTLIVRLEHNQALAEQDRQLDRLPYADGAAFDSRQRECEPPCIPDTRVDLLRQLQEWAISQGKSIFWLNGMAGTGKSTVARTIAQELSNLKRLGASFFFSRGAGDLGRAAKFVTTVAYQLSHIPFIRPHICEAIAQDSSIIRQGLRNQWKKLILEPFEKLSNSRGLNFTLIVDALDECEDEENIKLLLQLFVETKDLTDVKLKILITSRPEMPIRTGFQDMTDIVYQDLVIHDIPRSIVEKDISVYLEHELRKIRRTHKISSSWPGEKEFQLLVHKSECLFIYIATVCRFIGDQYWPPQERLPLILQGNDTSGGSQLDYMYSEVLKQSIFQSRSDQERAELSERFKLIIGSIVMLLDVLSATALANLLSVSIEQVNVTLHPLHSVLNIPKNQDLPIRLLHTSFRDFLLDGQRCQDVYANLDENEIHENLINSCLRLMSTTLKRDICHLKIPGARAKDLQNDTIDSHLSKEVQYACRYWLDHLDRLNHDRRIRCGLHDGGQIHDFLKIHLLHWLEALSLMRKVTEGVIMILKLDSMLEHHSPSTLRDLVHDTKRFVLNNRYIIEEAPLQLYVSTLVFSPEQSVIRNQHVSQFPTWIKNLPTVENRWSQTLQILQGHYHEATSVAFSPDGQQLASASYNGTVRLWDSKTGAILQTLENGLNWVRAVAFIVDDHHQLAFPKSSFDSRRLVSVSGRGTVRLWDLKTGAVLQSSRYPIKQIRFVAFSFDGQQLVIVARDGIMQLWDLKKRTTTRNLDDHTEAMTAIAFSFDGQQLASVSGEGTVRLWNSDAGAISQTLAGDFGCLTAVAFSFDGQQLAFASDDGIVRLCDLKTSTISLVLEDSCKRIISVAFSFDGQQLASASLDTTVRLWNAKTGATLQIFKGHSKCVTSVVFSPDGQLASGSRDGTVRLWNLNSNLISQPLDDHSAKIVFVAFSFDGQRLASASEDGIVRLWDLESGASETLEGHFGRIISAAFSFDGQQLAFASTDQGLSLWNSKTKTIVQIERDFLDIENMAFSFDGEQIAFGIPFRKVQLWDVKAGTASEVFRWGIRNWRLGEKALIGFSRDGQQLAFILEDDAVELWNKEMGGVSHTVNDHPLPFPLSRQQLPHRLYDKTAQLLNPKSGELHEQFDSEESPDLFSFFTHGSGLKTMLDQRRLTSVISHIDMPYGWSINEDWLT